MANIIIDCEGVEIIRPGGAMEHFGQVLHACENHAKKTFRHAKGATWPQKLPKPAPALGGPPGIKWH